MSKLLLILSLSFSLSAEEISQEAIEEIDEIAAPMAEEEERDEDERYCPSARKEGFFIESGILFMKAGQ